MNIKASVHRTMMGTNMESLLVDVIGRCPPTCVPACLHVLLSDARAHVQPRHARSWQSVSTKLESRTPAGTRRAAVGEVVEEEPYVCVKASVPGGRKDAANSDTDAATPRSALDNVVDKVLLEA